MRAEDPYSCNPVQTRSQSRPLSWTVRPAKSTRHWWTRFWGRCCCNRQPAAVPVSQTQVARAVVQPPPAAAVEADGWDEGPPPYRAGHNQLSVRTSDLDVYCRAITSNLGVKSNSSADKRTSFRDRILTLAIATGNNRVGFVSRARRCSSQ